jgi:hypothetical protein
MLTAAVFAAWSRPAPSEATIALYRSQLQLLEDADVARDVINELIQSDDWLPPIATIRAAYFDVIARRRDQAARERGLPEGDPRDAPIDPAVLAEIERLLGRPFQPFRDMDDAA